MSTTPSTRNRISESELHGHRELAESFGADPDRYDRTRPSYPDALVEVITAASPGGDVLDVGIGTGIAARQFRAAGCRVLGVEPDARMAAWARGSGIETEVATFEAWESSGRSFDVIISGQAWHWIDQGAGAAKAARVLRPGGRLAVFWNIEQPPPELMEGFAAVYRRVLPDSLVARQWMSNSLDGYAMLCAKAADGMRQAGVFGDAEEWRFSWERAYSRDEWLNQVPTHGDHSQYPPDRLADLLAGVGAAVDAVGGGFTMRYTTVAVTAVRADAPKQV